MATGLALSGLLMAGCTGSEAEEPDDVPPIGGDEPDPEPDPEPEEPEDPYAVPDDLDDIDADYVEAVVDAIFEITNEVFLAGIEAERGTAIPEEHLDQLGALYMDRRFASVFENLQQIYLMEDPEEFYLPPDEYGRSYFHVEQVLHVERECILAVGWFDLTETSQNPFPEGHRSVLSLGPKEGEQDSDAINPTPWAIYQIASMADPEGNQIPPGEWEDLDFGDNLARTCSER